MLKVLIWAIALDVAANAFGQTCVSYSSESPPFVATIETNGFMQHVAVRESDSIAFMTQYYEGLLTADVSDPTNPVTIGVTLFASSVDYIELSENLAIVILSDASVVILDATNPSSLVVLSSLQFSETVISATVSGSQLIISTYWSLEFYSIENPIQPVFEYSLDTPMDPSHSAVYGQYLYIANGSYGLQVVDLTGVPAIINSVELDGFSRYVNIHHGYAYVASHASAHILDLDSPGDPQLVASVQTEDSWRSVALYDNILYLVGYHNCDIYDVSVPEIPSYIGQTFSLWNGVNCHGGDVYANADYVFLTGNTCGTRITPAQCTGPNVKIEIIGNDAVLTWIGYDHTQWNVYKLVHPLDELTSETLVAEVTEPAFTDVNALTQGNGFYVVTTSD